jgi:plastocyanin
MRVFARHHRAVQFGLAVVPVAVAGLLLAGCDDGTTADAGSAATPTAVSGTDAPGFVPNGSPAGAMSGMPGMPAASGPAAITVKVGTTVTWTNKDSDPHTVTTSNGPLHSPTMQGGATFSYTFTAAGTFNYLCTIHPFMTATVTVTP